MRSASRALIGLLAVVLAASLAHAGYTNDGYESNGYQGNGYGSNGFESNGYESNGYRATDTGSPSLDAVLSSLLFGNPQVRDAFLNLPFTAYHLTNDGAGLGPAEALTRARQHALYQVWSDPDSQKLLAYLWAAAHAFHDDLDHDPCLVAGTGSCPVKFWGRLGLCDRGTPAAPRGAAVDQPLVQDVKCQHWLSAVFLAQNNQLGYRDLIGLNGPTSTPDTAGTSFVGNQLTWQSEHVTAFRYVKDSKNAVDAVTRACDATTGTTGPVNCGWVPGPVGVCTPNDSVHLAATADAPVPIIVQVVQGVHAHNYPFATGGMCDGLPPPCPDADFLGASIGGSNVRPVVSFHCPSSGTFNVVWAKYDRRDLHNVAPSFALHSESAPCAYPANETDVFKRQNLEAYFAGNIFGQANLSAVHSGCETRIGATAAPCDPESGGSGGVKVCDPNVSVCCSPCVRTSTIIHSEEPDPIGDVDRVRDRAADAAYVAFTNPLATRVFVSSVHVNAAVLGPDVEGVIVGMKPGTFRTDALLSSTGVPALVPDLGDLRRSAHATRNTGCSDCRLQVAFDPPVAIDPGEYLAFGLVPSGNDDADAVAYRGDPSIANTFMSSGGTLPGRWSGFYHLGDSAATYWHGANSTNGNAGRGVVVVAGNTPANPAVVFPNAHIWIANRWTAADPAYFHERACTSDRSACMAKYEGAIDSGPAPCLNVGLDADTNTSLPTPRPLLKDVGGCSLGNLTGGTPVLFLFNEGAGPYLGYGVTTFFPNYGDGVDGVVVPGCASHTAPVTPPARSASVCGGQQVTLSSAGTYDVDGDALTYTWTELNNAVAPLSGSSPTFTAPYVLGGTTLTFTLTVTDSCQLSSSTTVTVTVKDGNVAPVAAIDTVAPVKEGAAVTLDGGHSYDPQADPLSYAWTQIAGPAVTLANATTATPSFVAPGVPGVAQTVTLRFQLAVTDVPTTTGVCGGPLTGKATVDVVVERLNHAPIADAGASSTVQEGATVTLDGTGSSDPDGDPLSYAWVQTAGTSVVLAGANTAAPSFTAPAQPPTAQETLTFRLTVSDPGGRTSAATVDIVVQDIYAPPDCTRAVPSVGSIWPPDHRMIPISVAGMKADDPAITLFVAINGIWQDEPTSGLGSGDTPIDGTKNADGTAFIRAERSAKGDGRVYHLGYTADDGYGGTCRGVVKVCVPRDASKTPTCGDQGALYVSTAP